MFDLLGSINAAFLAHEHATKTLVEDYPNFVRQVFVENNRRINRISSALVDANGLRNMAATLFPRQAKMLSKRLLIVSTQLNNHLSGPEQQPDFIYENNFGAESFSGPDFCVANAVIASCSAPTYFGSYQGRVDGGVVTNTPVMPCLQVLIDRYGIDILSRVRLLSIGTGFAPTGMPVSLTAETNETTFGEEGVYDWLKGGFGIRVFFALQKQRDHAMAKTLLGDNFHRLDWGMPELIDMLNTAPETFVAMEQICKDKDMAETMHFIEHHYLK